MGSQEVAAEVLDECDFELAIARQAEQLQLPPPS
jgi:hypothetical protein